MARRSRGDASGPAPVTLVDTSVWIDFFAGREAAHVARLERLLAEDADVAICGINLTEILQGLRDEVSVQRVRRFLEPLILLPMGESVFVAAATLYRELRAKGVTIRKTNDCIIAATAMAHDCALLHNDRDFTSMARHVALVVTD